MSATASLGPDGPWFRSSYSNGAGGECLECAITRTAVGVRDSKNPEIGAIAVSHTAWAPFVRSARRAISVAAP
ncbi:DUF397 domain-containing protein [Streptomyces sp. SID7958]|uniref:DUF397 domain-containing protein n=2 Tax=unclassified Streptomyces TaxID=2593676 RepID=A0A6G3QYI6_9ACTN|nr:DUF397 domain-containing protein [Streptomyces sp. SID14436]NEC81692.1 DUF397 domain-containing protein [Streptomyces sp. SID7958]